MTSEEEKQLVRTWSGVMKVYVSVVLLSVDERDRERVVEKGYQISCLWVMEILGIRKCRRVEEGGMVKEEQLNFLLFFGGVRQSGARTPVLIEMDNWMSLQKSLKPSQQLSRSCPRNPRLYRMPPHANDRCTRLLWCGTDTEGQFRDLRRTCPPNHGRPVNRPLLYSHAQTGLYFFHAVNL